MKTVKRRKAPFARLGWALLIITAVLVGLFLPTLATNIQRDRTDRIRETVELGNSALSLTSDRAKLEKLSLLAESEYRDYTSVIVSGGIYMSRDDARAMVYEIPRLIEGTELICTNMQIKNINWMEPLILVSQSSGVNTSVVWCANGQYSDGTNDCTMEYYVDDESGLILGAGYYEGTISEEYPSENMEENTRPEPDYSAAVKRIAENICGIYKFTNTTAELDVSTAVGDKHNFAINFYTDGERVLTMPVYIEGNGSWRINLS